MSLEATECSPISDFFLKKQRYLYSIPGLFATGIYSQTESSVLGKGLQKYQ